MKPNLLLLFFLFASSGVLSQHLQVLGVVQDGGYPHIGCMRECQKAHNDATLARFVTSIAVVDPTSKTWWMLEASPDLDKQLQYFRDLTGGEYAYLPEGIFVTHAHIGHYTGLMYLGKEALGAQHVKTYALPGMVRFLETNGPWGQLVVQENIDLIELTANNPFPLKKNIQITAFTVPHRDEYSETAGFKIETKNKNYLFIPDIDKWGKWDHSIVEEVKNVDYAFIDATFFQDGELPGRPISEIPHPFVEETMRLFDNEANEVRSKVHFIHFNHTNPILFDDQARREVLNKGYNIAIQGKAYR